MRWLAYAETPPSVPLASVVSAVWSHQRRADARPDRTRRILPDGSADVVLGFAPVGLSPAGPLALVEVWVVGTMTTARVVDAGAPAAHVGVRFRPEAAGRVFGVAAHALADGRMPLDALWPDAEALFAPVARVPDLARARALVAVALATRLSPLAPPVEVTRAVRLFEASGGRARVADVSRALGVTRQHLARQFARHVGLAPKVFARVARFRALDAGLRAFERRGARVCWGALAHAHGYADQPHLVDEVRALTGLPPTAWLHERRPADESTERRPAVPFAQDRGASGV